MERIVAYECPNCKTPVFPKEGVFECVYCGSFLRLIKTYEGPQYISIVHIHGNNITEVTRKIATEIQLDGDRTRRLLQDKYASNEGGDKIALAFYLSHLDDQKKEIKEKIKELESNNKNGNNDYKLNKERQNLKEQNKRIEQIECIIEPGRAEERRKKLEKEQKNQNEQIGLLIFFCAVLLIAVIVGILSSHTGNMPIY